MTTLLPVLASIGYPTSRAGALFRFAGGVQIGVELLPSERGFHGYGAGAGFGGCRGRARVLTRS